MATNTRFIHVRRCHVCGTVNEMTNAAIHRCGSCKKAFAPFYYFDEGELRGLSDNCLEMSQWKQSATYYPLYGFSTYWEEENWHPSD